MSSLSAHERPRLRPRVLLVVVLLLLLVAASVAGERGLLRLYQMHRTRTALIREVETLSAANAALAEEVQALRTDPDRLESIAREELGLVRPGEIVYEFRAVAPPRSPAEAR